MCTNLCFGIQVPREAVWLWNLSIMRERWNFASLLQVLFNMKMQRPPSITSQRLWTCWPLDRNKTAASYSLDNSFKSLFIKWWILYASNCPISCSDLVVYSVFFLYSVQIAWEMSLLIDRCCEKVKVKVTCCIIISRNLLMLNVIDR